MLTTRNLFLSVIIVFLCSCSSLQKHAPQNATTKIYNKVGTIDIDAIHQQVRVINNLNLQKEKAIQKLKPQSASLQAASENPSCAEPFRFSLRAARTKWTRCRILFCTIP